MITLDGSMGEGGGQVLRTALALSLVTGQPFAIDQIRAGREKPGLKRQHLTAVLAAAEVGNAAIEGAELGSMRLTFKPKDLRGGDYKFAIGTAGSTTLVLQTVLPALLTAAAPSSIELVGGTHNPLAPPFDFLQHTWAPLLRRMGAPLELELLQHGFFPAGGGVMRVRTSQAKWSPLSLVTVPEQAIVSARIVHSQLPANIARREADTLAAVLGIARDQIVTVEVRSPGPGNAVLVHVGLGEVTEVIAAFGERSVTAEAVATGAAREAQALLAAKVPVGQYLADQLLLPMAMAGGGAVLTVEPSLHTKTNAQVIEHFLPVRFGFHATAEGWRIEVG